MNKKLKKSLIGLGATTAAFAPIVASVSFAVKETSNGFVFMGRMFHSNAEAMNYLINNKMIDISESKVVGDLPHAFANSEKGLINKYLLPDYVPSNIGFAYFNRGGAITRDYEEAKNSYYSLGDASVRYFDGFGGSFPNALEAQRSLRQKIVGEGSLGFYNVGFFNQLAKTAADDFSLIKRINPLNANDISDWKDNVSENISQIIRDTLVVNKNSKYTFEFVDKPLITKEDILKQINNLVKDSIRDDKNFSYNDSTKDLTYEESGNQPFSWSEDSWCIGTWEWNDDHEYNIGFNKPHETIRVHARDYDRNFFWFLGKDYSFDVDDFKNLINMKNTIQGDMHPIHTYDENLPKAYTSNLISGKLDSIIKNIYCDHIFSELPSSFFDASQQLLNISKSDLYDKLVPNLFDNIALNNEKINFSSGNMHVDLDNSHETTSDGGFWHKVDNYITINQLNGSIDYNHAVTSPNFENTLNRAYEKLSNKFNLLNQLFAVKDKPSPIKIKYDGKEIFNGMLSSDGTKFNLPKNSLVVPKSNHNAPSESPVKNNGQFENPLDAINCLVKDMDDINKSGNFSNLKRRLQDWDNSTNDMILNENFALGDERTGVTNRVKFQKNMLSLVHNIKMLIGKYGGAISLLKELMKNILDINPSEFVELDEDLFKTEFVIDSIDKVNPKFFTWVAPTKIEDYQTQLRISQQVVPPAVQVLYDPNGKEFSSDNYNFDNEGVMEYNFLRDIVVRRDNDHIYINGYTNPFVNVITSIYHLHMNNDDQYFDTFNHLKEYVEQNIMTNSQKV